MSDQDIVERLRNPMMGIQYVGPDGRSAVTGSGIAVMEEASARKDMSEAADIIAALRYDYQRDAEKIAAQALQIEQLRAQVGVLERLCGAVSKGDGDFREVTKDVPRKRWPHVGTHE